MSEKVLINLHRSHLTAVKNRFKLLVMVENKEMIYKQMQVIKELKTVK